MSGKKRQEDVLLPPYADINILVVFDVFIQPNIERYAVLT